MLAEAMLEATDRLSRGTRRIRARVLVAPSLDSRTRLWLARAADRFGVSLLDVDPGKGAMPDLGVFDASISASGTATLESALSGVPPVVVYRMGRISAALAKRLVRTPHIALPNVVLGRRCYPELVGDEVDGRRLAEAVSTVLGDRRRFADAAAELRCRLDAPFATDPRRSMADRCCTMIEDWT
jgi:lipid-A-disaccharide synthase